MSATSIWHPSREGRLPARQGRPVGSPRRGAGRWVVLIVGSGIVLAAAWWVTNSKVFDLHTVRVRGTVHLSAGRVERLAGLEGRTNVFWMDTRAVEERVESSPWVLSAHVTRMLPSAIAIAIEERIPVAVGVGSTHVLLAADGTILGTAGPPARLPLVELPPGPKPVVGERLAWPLPQLGVAAALPPDLRDQVASIGRSSPTSIVLSLRSGVVVDFGDSSRAMAKARALAAVMSWAARHGVEPATVDVRAPSAPGLMPVGAGALPPPSG